MGTPREKQPSAKIQWHPAFCAAAEVELRSNKGDLEFKREYNLSKKPLQMDLLIIEKRKGVQIQNEIGKIFRGHNIIEYKSPDDGMTIDDFFKTLGYAFLYKGLGEKVNQIPLSELTVSLFRASVPKELLSPKIMKVSKCYQKVPRLMTFKDSQNLQALLPNPVTRKKLTPYCKLASRQTEKNMMK